MYVALFLKQCVVKIGYEFAAWLLFEQQESRDAAPPLQAVVLFPLVFETYISPPLAFVG
jgi:hypothetical protein